jgi:hypothetical protein
MSGIGDIPHITHLKTQILEIPIHYIEGDIGSSMPEMTLAADGRAAYIHANSARC